MIANQHINALVSVIMAVAVLLCLGAVAFADNISEAIGEKGVTMAYESALFDTSKIITVNLIMDDAAWDEMLENATSEEYYECDVAVNETMFHSVGIRPKGNTSLSSIASDPDTDRFSLKLEFDHYIDGQTCFGLDKLILNNNYADASNMKEAVVYDMYQYLGADASLYNYATISVNGAYWGVYLALEAVEDSFMLRNYGTETGALYKPDSMEIGGGMGGDQTDFDGSNKQGGQFSPDNLPEGFDKDKLPEDFAGGDFPRGARNGEQPAQSDGDTSDTERMKGGGKGGFSMDGSGANLEYTDDALDSYSTIWEGAITKTKDSDHQRVVTALKNTSAGNDLETYLDVENLLKYMAVHVFSVNADSLSGSMAHNYYLYESKGQLNLLPWDYNLALGGMSMGNVSGASGVVNDAIDTPFDGTNFFDALLTNETYLAKYHEYLGELTEAYGDSGRFDALYQRIRAQIDQSVETDPTAFYSYDAYDAGAEMLYQTVNLRLKSIKGQLDGTIPSTDALQKADSSALIDASDINLPTMGTMNMGGNAMQPNGNTPPQGQMPNGFDPSNLPDGFDPSDVPDGFDPSGMPGGAMTGSAITGSGSTSSTTTASETGSSAQDDSKQSETTGMPSDNGFSFSGRPSTGTASSNIGKNLLTDAICFAILAVAIVFAATFRRKSKKL